MKIPKKIARKVLSNRLTRKLYIKNSKTYVNQCKNWIDGSSNILDIGCGNGYTSSELMKGFNSKLLGLDIENFLSTDIPFQKFDGLNIPFPEKSFDVSLFIYVLHHASDQEKLLKEAKKVTKKYIIVYEDVINNRRDKITSAIHGKLFSMIYGINSKCMFKNEREWIAFFENCGLEVLMTQKVPLSSNLMYPVSRMQFVLGTSDHI